MGRVTWLVATAVLSTALRPSALAQEQPAIDRTDPAAVAKAYVEACRIGDLDTALSLLAADDPLRGVIAEAATEMGAEMEAEGFTLMGFLTELLFTPVKVPFPDELLDSREDGDTATVRFQRTYPIEQKLILERAEDGTWSVDALRSVKATTGLDHSFLEMQARAQAGAGGGGPDTSIYESHNCLRTLGRALDEYVDANGGYPLASEWMDALQPYVLDPDAFRCPAAPDLEHGYAMNALAGGQPRPADWQDRQSLLLLFEWPSGERNATAMPEELATAKSFRPDGAIAILDATGNTRALMKGMTFAELIQAEDDHNQCYSHLGTLVKAAREYARDNGGLLPSADTWQDDIGPYLIDVQDLAELYTCPAAPGLEHAYAINAEVAGKNAMELSDHGSVVLFFESDLNVPNASGMPATDAPAVGRHVGAWSGEVEYLMAYLGGNVGGRPALAAPGNE